KLAADVRAAPVGEHEIEDDSIRRVRRRLRQRLRCCGGDLDLIAGALQARAQRPQDLRFVIDDQDAQTAHRGSAAWSVTAGSASAKVDPPRAGSEESTQTRPPFASANPRAIARPRPLPRSPPLPRSNASKIRSRSASATPGPRSRTRTTIASNSATAETSTGSVGEENFSAFSSR